MLNDTSSMMCMISSYDRIVYKFRQLYWFVYRSDYATVETLFSLIFEKSLPLPATLPKFYLLHYCSIYYTTVTLHYYLNFFQIIFLFVFIQISDTCSFEYEGRTSWAIVKDKSLASYCIYCNVNMWTLLQFRTHLPFIEEFQARIM